MARWTCALPGRDLEMPLERAPAGEAASAPRIGGGPLILIVDDDKDSRETARMVLEEEGYVVDVASNGRAALDRLQSAPRPTLMLVDLMMPVMDGPSLLVELESSGEHAGIPVVVMTASGPDSRTSGLRYPMLRKPFNLDDLMRIVTECAPRFWDDEEPTDETPIPFDRAITGRSRLDDATPRVLCATCDLPASARCVGCGEAYCRRCIDGGTSIRCPKCLHGASA
jgi:CheY-like chemotaxis protein